MGFTKPVIFCLCVVVLFALTALPGLAAVITVSQGGPISSLAAAVGTAADGDTINVEAGPSAYVEGTLIINQNSLTIQGTNGTPRFTGTSLYLAGTGVTLRNLTVDGEGAPGMDVLVNLTSSANQATIESCTLVNPASGTGTGVPTLDDPSSVANAGIGLRINGSDQVSVRDCNFECTPDPDLPNQVDLSDLAPTDGSSDDLLVEHCRFGSQGKNILLVGTHNRAVIRDNAFNRSGGVDGSRGGQSVLSTCGIVIMPQTAADGAVFTDTRIENNDFNSVSGVGVYVY